MRLEYYYYLIRLVEAGSLSKAAASLYISTQGLSKAMQQLGTELGSPIFFRGKEGLRLTKAGHEVYEAAKQIVSIQEGLKDAIYAEGERTRGLETTIYSTPHVNAAYLRKCLGIYHRKKPNTAIKMIELPPREICDLNNVLDDSVRFFSIVEPTLDRFLDSLDDDYVFCEMDRVPVLCRVSSRSDLAKRKSISSKDLAGYALALYINENDIIDILFGAEFDLAVRSYVSDYALLCELIANDTSVVGVTDLLFERNLIFPSVTAIPLEPHVNTVYGYIVRKDGQISTPVVEILEIVHDELKFGVQNK